jgi:hypothetical protein
MPGATYIETNAVPQAARSITDDISNTVGQDFSRQLTVSTDKPYWWLPPMARALYIEDFEDTLFKWVSAGDGGSTAARDATRAHTKTACLKLVTPAVAGQGARARKNFMLPADQGSQLGKAPADRTARNIVGCYFQLGDAVPALRYFAIRLLIDDSNIQREAWTIYSEQFGLLAYLDSTGGQPSTGQVYPIDSGGFPTPADNSAPWNLLMLELDKENGTDANGGYCWYRSARISDMVWKPTPFTIPAKQQASAGARFCQVDLIAVANGAAAATVYVDDFVLSDLSWAMNQ